jgi:hypothetical protein
MRQSRSAWASSAWGDVGAVAKLAAPSSSSKRPQEK